MLEELPKLVVAVAFPVFEASFRPTLAIAHFAPDIAAKILPAVCAGDMVVAISMSELQAGTALTDLKTTGLINGDTVVVTAPNAGAQEAAMPMHMLYIVVYPMHRAPKALAPLTKRTHPASVLARLNNIWGGAALLVPTCISTMLRSLLQTL